MPCAGRYYFSTESDLVRPRKQSAEVLAVITPQDPNYFAEFNLYGIQVVPLYGERQEPIESYYPEDNFYQIPYDPGYDTLEHIVVPLGSMDTRNSYRYLSAVLISKTDYYGRPIPNQFDTVAVDRKKLMRRNRHVRLNMTLSNTCYESPEKYWFSKYRTHLYID